MRSPREDDEIMALAGLWEGWKAPDGEILRTFAIITTDANAEMAALHDRMPVIVEQADWPLWLGEVDGDPASMLRTLRAWPISRAINTPRNKGPDLLDALASET
jgi:putative SOS response-associated peptidase YedK